MKIFRFIFQLFKEFLEWFVNTDLFEFIIILSLILGFIALQGLIIIPFFILFIIWLNCAYLFCISMILLSILEFECIDKRKFPLRVLKDFIIATKVKWNNFK